MMHVSCIFSRDCWKPEHGARSRVAFARHESNQAWASCIHACVYLWKKVDYNIKGTAIIWIYSHLYSIHGNKVGIECCHCPRKSTGYQFHLNISLRERFAPVVTRSGLASALTCGFEEVAPFSYWIPHYQLPWFFIVPSHIAEQVQPLSSSVRQHWAQCWCGQSEGPCYCYMFNYYSLFTSYSGTMIYSPLRFLISWTYCTE